MTSAPRDAELPDLPRATGRIELKQQDQHLAFSGDDREDRYGNRWRIDVTGDQQVVKVFLSEGRLDMEAEPLSDDEWQQLIKERAAAEEQQKNNRSRSAEAPAARPVQEQPTLEIRLTLAKRAFTQPYFRVRYSVFVPDAGSSIHTHTLDAGNDGWAYVAFLAQGGSISVEIGSAFPATGLSGSVSQETRGVRWWTVVVEKGPNTSYDLWGDAIYPTSG